MATFKISQLPAVTSIAGTEELEVNQSSTSKKATASQLRAGLAISGAVTGSGLTMTADRLLGRTTAGTGAIEEISIGSGLTLSAGTLAATGGGGGVSSFSTGTTGLTPATSTTGSVTLGGTLVVANGGTGATNAGTARTNLSAAGSGANSDITSLTGLTTALSGAQGGTGVINTGKTITLGGNLTTSGAFAATLGLTATTSVTLPTTGTLATLAGTETLSGKTINRAILNDGYTEEVFAITDGGTVNLDPNNGSIQTWTLGASRTPGQANWAAGQSITLMVDDGSAFTITWSTLSVIWETNGGAAPTLATTGFTVIALWKVGTTIYGARVGDA